MLFNSIDFAVFLPIVYILYWFVTNKNLKWQNILILVSSYLFYGWWDYRFLSLIVFSTVVDYLLGLLIFNSKKEQNRRYYLWGSVIVNIGLLGFFKYYNFFLDNFISAFSFFGFAFNINALDIVLPVGISFYTFQTLSYTIDIYKRKLEPTTDFVAFAGFVAFFPQLVAGPIERATNLLPQFYRKRKFDYRKTTDGLRQILWGLFKKIVIADSCGEMANMFFDNSQMYNGSALLLGTIFFTFQVYGDFSGYSDIAIGVSRLFGFNLMKNFAFPFFSRDIAEFWRRWHISLLSWFKDYIYIPLGGGTGSTFIRFRNVMIVFLISGFWHGANWTYVIYALIHGLCFLPRIIIKSNRTYTDIVAGNGTLPSFNELMQMLFTFLFVSITFIIFRAENLTHASQYLMEVFSPSLFSVPNFNKKTDAMELLLIVFAFFTVEWFGRRNEFGIAKFKFYNYWPLRYGFYYSILIMIYTFLKEDDMDFIYFQF